MLAGIRTSNNLVHVPIVKSFGLIVLPLLMFASSAPAEGSEEQLQNTIDGIIKVLKTIRTPPDIDKNRNAIRQLLLTRFDLAAMAQRSLGNRWNDLRGNQQEFVSCSPSLSNMDTRAPSGRTEAKESCTTRTGSTKNLPKWTRELSPARGLRSKSAISSISPG